MREFNRVCQSHPQTPKIVLASQPDMEAGFSRELFLEWCADPRNSIILTQRTQMRSLAYKLTHMALAGEQVGACWHAHRDASSCSRPDCSHYKFVDGYDWKVPN
jgi:Cft2 family RNA processing exonuclease